jgi:hypothetical protein
MNEVFDVIAARWPELAPRCTAIRERLERLF